MSQTIFLTKVLFGICFFVKIINLIISSIDILNFSESSTVLTRIVGTQTMVHVPLINLFFKIIFFNLNKKNINLTQSKFRKNKNT